MVPPMLQFCNLCHSLSVRKQLYTGTNYSFTHTIREVCMYVLYNLVWEYKQRYYHFSLSSSMYTEQGFITYYLRIQAASAPPVSGLWLMEFFFLVTSEVTSGWAQTSDSAHSGRLYSAALTSVPALTLSHSHYPDTESASPCPILIILSAWLGSTTYIFYKSLV